MRSLSMASNGLQVAISSPNTAGRFVKLDKTFPNEIAALQAIAVSYRPN